MGQHPAILQGMEAIEVNICGWGFDKTKPKREKQKDY